MSKHKWMNDDTDEFLLAISEVKNLAEARAFLGDILTEKEMKECANRWKAAKMLHFGVGYRKIQKATGMSSATVSRIKQNMHTGLGGYHLMIAKIEK